MSAAKGSRYERRMVNLLEDLGYTALRIPASGAATSSDLPDILAGKAAERKIIGPERKQRYPDAGENDYISETASDAMAIELKSGKATTLYVEESEVEALCRFARGFGATPYLCARPTTQASETAFYCVRPDDARQTDGGAYGLPIDGIEDRAEVVFYE